MATCGDLLMATDTECGDSHSVTRENVHVSGAPARDRPLRQSLHTV